MDNRFEPVKEIAEATEALLTHLRTLGRGNIVKHTEIEAVIGIKRKFSRYRTVLEKARRIFLDKDGVALEPVNGVGFRLMTKDGQLIDAPIRRTRKRITQHRKAAAELMGVSREKLTEHEQKILREEYERTQAAAREEKGHERFLRALKPNSQPLPSLLEPK